MSCLIIVAIFIEFVYAYATLLPSTQPSRTGYPKAYEIIANSLVSAQQMFLGTESTVYMLDKTENNPATINGHPAWASEFNLSGNDQRVLDAITNTFCAGGNVLGNGTWVVVGGNSPVTYGGQSIDTNDGQGPYGDPDGRNSLLDPCDDQQCNWSMSPFQTQQQRWYPSVETLEDGTLIILGGSKDAVYVNNAINDNPTYEYFPPNGPPVFSPTIQRTLPVNLYPLTWLLPSGNLLVQTGWETILLDRRQQREYSLSDMPHAIRTYPASAGTIMLPLTPSNNYTATILFCGGSNIKSDKWTSPDFIPLKYSASSSCVRITPDISGSYEEDDPLPEGRTMANLIFLPDGKILCLNGARIGTAGYGNTSWAVGQSYADEPLLTPAIYDPSGTHGSRWSREGLRDSTVPRMYHSSATLLPDGSVLVSGSNPNYDYNVGTNVKYPTEYRTENFYPDYYNNRRPQPVGIPSQLSYGGAPFDLFLDNEDLFGNVENVMNTKVNLVRTGFSTHSMNMGQRYVELESTYTGYHNDTAILHVSQVPPNPALLAPGPALLFVVVNGVPSVGKQVMVGSGQLGFQEIEARSELPASKIVRTSPMVLKGVGNHSANFLASGGWSVGNGMTLWESTCGFVLAALAVLW
ncbi:hypothetical protein AX17_006966 [Amanita inopinata Kibby_2008]|nr:hypothetical protein AX17_006966 [Amanita inopinata Kibby_2008]